MCNGREGDVVFFCCTHPLLGQEGMGGGRKREHGEGYYTPAYTLSLSFDQSFTYSLTHSLLLLTRTLPPGHGHAHGFPSWCNPFGKRKDHGHGHHVRVWCLLCVDVYCVCVRACVWGGDFFFFLGGGGGGRGGGHACVKTICK